jgi:hypothetical protein
LERRPASSTLALLGVAVLAGFVASTPGAADPANPDHDIVDVEVGVDAEHLLVNVTVAGDVPTSEAGERAFEVTFTVRSSQERDAGTETGRRYAVTLPGDHYVLQERVGGEAVRSTTLQPQPTADGDKLRFKVDRSSARAAPDEPLEAGDAVVDVEAAFLRDGEAVDREAGPDLVVPDRGLDADGDLHLVADAAVPPLRSRALAPTPPGPAGPPRTDVLAADEARTATFTSAPLDSSLVLESGTANLWLSSTTTTPVVALNAPGVQLYAMSPDGERTLLAERRDVARPGPNPNVFTTPGEPHEMTWPLVFYRDRVPAHARLQLEVRSQGLLGEGAQGPHVLHYNSSTYDSILHLDGRTGEEPRVDATVPPLGERVSTWAATTGPSPRRRRQSAARRRRRPPATGTGRWPAGPRSPSIGASPWRTPGPPSG